MDKFSELTTWDSKWMPDTLSMVMGRRNEWKNDDGVVVGINICRLDSNEQAKKAAKMQGTLTYSEVFNMDSLISLQEIINKWNDSNKGEMEEKLFSVVGFNGNLIVHFYQFDSTKVNTDLTFSLIEKLSEQISNF